MEANPEVPAWSEPDIENPHVTANRIWREIMDTSPGLAMGAVHWILLQRIAASLTVLGARRAWIEDDVAAGIALGEAGSCG